MEYFAYSQKAFIYKYVVMLSDADQFKHMSFANYLRLMFLAADALFLKIYNHSFLSEYQLRHISSRMQFKRQSVAGDGVLIKVNSSNVEEDRFTLLFTFVLEDTGELVGLGRQQYQLFNLGQKTSANQLTEAIKQTLEPIIVNEENLIYQY